MRKLLTVTTALAAVLWNGAVVAATDQPNAHNLSSVQQTGPNNDAVVTQIGGGSAFSRNAAYLTQSQGATAAQMQDGAGNWASGYQSGGHTLLQSQAGDRNRASGSDAGNLGGEITQNQTGNDNQASAWQNGDHQIIEQIQEGANNSARALQSMGTGGHSDIITQTQVGSGHYAEANQQYEVSLSLIQQYQDGLANRAVAGQAFDVTESDILQHQLGVSNDQLARQNLGSSSVIAQTQVGDNNRGLAFQGDHQISGVWHYSAGGTGNSIMQTQTGDNNFASAGQASGGGNYTLQVQGANSAYGVVLQVGSNNNASMVQNN